MIILFAIILAMSFVARGQNTSVWRKDVSRTILLLPGKHKYDFNLFDTISDGIKRNKIRAYSHYNYTFTKLTRDEILEIYRPPLDTTSIVNYVLGQEPTGPQPPPLIADSVYQYQIFENWTYDPSTYKTQIQVKAIAPVVNFYGDDSAFKGRKSLFWLMYDALNNLLSTNPQHLQQLDRLTNLAWADFFEADSAGPAVPPKYLLATRTISVYEDEDTVHHHLANETADTLLSEILIEAIQHNKITAWDADDYMLQKKLPASEITKMITPKPDTIIYPDLPITGSETMKIVVRDFNFGTINTYKILEDWTFDPHTGQIGSRVIAIAPLQYILDDTGAWKQTNTMCWLRIEDVKSMIAKYEEYHPTNTIAQQIWYSYFLSGDKPEVVKTFY